MKTTQQWLSEIKSDNKKLEGWLQRQHIGEVLAAERIKSLSEQTTESIATKKLLNKIASDESKHAEWVYELLKVRNIDVLPATYEDTRYWEPILGNINSFQEIAGAGHHAEAMRLVRIKALVDDPEIDSDIRQVFTKILPDEEMHTKAFESMSTIDAIESTRNLHNSGLKILGLSL